jgi:hypothetical protein
MVRRRFFSAVSNHGPRVSALRPSFETHRFAMLLRIRAYLVESKQAPLLLAS